MLARASCTAFDVTNAQEIAAEPTSLHVDADAIRAPKLTRHVQVVIKLTFRVAETSSIRRQSSAVKLSSRENIAPQQQCSKRLEITTEIRFRPDLARWAGIGQSALLVQCPTECGPEAIIDKSDCRRFSGSRPRAMDVFTLKLLLCGTTIRRCRALISRAAVWSGDRVLTPARLTSPGVLFVHLADEKAAAASGVVTLISCSVWPSHPDARRSRRRWQSGIDALR